MYSIWFTVLCAFLISATVQSQTIDCNAKFAVFMEKYTKCFTSVRTVLTKPLFYKLEELYNKEITDEDFVQYKIDNCPRLQSGLDCVLAIELADGDLTCPAISGILARFRDEKISFGYICDLDNQQFMAAISDGGINCVLARKSLGICIKNKSKEFDGVIDRCDLLKMKKDCLATSDSACMNSSVDTHLSAIVDALQKDSKCGS